MMDERTWAWSGVRTAMNGRCIGGPLHGVCRPITGRHHGEIVYLAEPDKGGPTRIKAGEPVTAPTRCSWPYRVAEFHNGEKTWRVWLPTWVREGDEMAFVIAAAIGAGPGDGADEWKR